MIEDSVAGVTGGVAAGMRVIGFTGASHTWPGHGEALMEAGALTVIRRLADVPATVEALREWRPRGALGSTSDPFVLTLEMDGESFARSRCAPPPLLCAGAQPGAGARHALPPPAP